jgi:hypothetical protein
MVGNLLEQLEKDRVQARSKYLLASKLLPGHALDPGAPPYQDFSLLIDLRNALAHPRAQTEPPRFLEQFENKGWTYNARPTNPNCRLGLSARDSSGRVLGMYGCSRDRVEYRREV